MKSLIENSKLTAQSYGIAMPDMTIQADREAAEPILYSAAIETGSHHDT